MKTAFYDFTQSPYSFDFVTFLVAARSNGCERIVLVPGKRMVKLPDGREIEFQKCTEAEQAERLRTIILSLCPDAIQCATRDEARAYWSPGCYPHGYTVDMPKSGHMLKDVLRCKEIWRLKARFHYGTDRPYALINLRESRIKPERNSRIDEWIKVAHWLQDGGIAPIFVPDSDNIDRDLEPFSVSKEAATSAAHRLVLMAGAAMTLGVCHGPMALALLSPYPFLVFRLLDERQWETSASFWNLMGVPLGAQLPWFTSEQRYVWQDDTAENIIRAIKRVFHVKQKEAA